MTLEWPPNFLDLSPSDYYAWNSLTNSWCAKAIRGEKVCHFSASAGPISQQCSLIYNSYKCFYFTVSMPVCAMWNIWTEHSDFGAALAQSFCFSNGTRSRSHGQRKPWMQKEIGSTDMYNICSIMCCNNLETITDQMDLAPQEEDCDWRAPSTGRWEYVQFLKTSKCFLLYIELQYFWIAEVESGFLNL